MRSAPSKTTVKRGVAYSELPQAKAMRMDDRCRDEKGDNYNGKII